MTRSHIENAMNKKAMAILNDFDVYHWCEMSH